METDDITAMVLAGGRGRRMGILCDETPKPTLPVGGISRVIDFTLSNCVHSDIPEIAVLTDYQRDVVRGYVKRWSAVNSDLGQLYILEPKDGSYRSTADAVYQNLDYLQALSSANVLILPSDHIYKMDYREMVAFHRGLGADLTIGVASVPREEAHRFGNIIVDRSGRVKAYLENAQMPQSSLASMGIFLFNTRILAERLLEETGSELSPDHGFERRIIPRMLGRDRVFPYKFDGYWSDIGNTKSYYAANMVLTLPKPLLRLEGRWPVVTEFRDSPADEYPKRKAENSIIAEGCQIKGRVENSVLSPGVCIEEGALVRDSIVMSNALVGCDTVVERSILDEDVIIGEGCAIGHGHNRDRKEEGPRLTIVGKGVTVPRNVTIGHNSEVHTYMGPGDFEIPLIPPGSSVSREPKQENATRIVT
jgi:glucose-1-phosphate adenylyltransferase